MKKKESLAIQGKTNNMYMNDIIIKTRLIQYNGDSTETHECCLCDGEVTVRDFAEAVEESIRANGAVFCEWWATVDISVIGEDGLAATYTTYGREKNRFRDPMIHGEQSTVQQILAKYGDCVVQECRWYGGWGSGGYHIKVKNVPPRITADEILSSHTDVSDLVARIDRAKALALACQDTAERMRYAQIKRALEHELARATWLKNFGFGPREGGRE